MNKQNYMIVAYYTLDTGYEPLACKLIKNLDSLNLEYDIHGIKNLGSWALNDFYRPVFLQQMLKKYTTIVSLDVDCIVYKPLDFCNHLTNTIAMRKINGTPILGTMYLWGKQAVGIMQLWEEACVYKKAKRYTSQEALRQLLKEYNFHVSDLPKEYAILQCSEKIPDNAVVVHDYASRKLKCRI